MAGERKGNALAGMASAFVANRTVIRLVAILAAKGVLDAGEVEALRHLHLHDFDELFASQPDKEAREAMARDRDLLERDWQAAQQVPFRGIDPSTD